MLYKVEENFVKRISEILKLHTKLREAPALPKGINHICGDWWVLLQLHGK